MDKKHLLKVKATLKKRTPKFIRQDAHKHKRVGKKWRAPKGLHSKMRDSRRGYRLKLKSGYQTPRDIRGHDKHGLLPFLISTPDQLKTLDPKVNSLIIAAGVGGRKKIMILEQAAEKNFTVLNAGADTASKMKTAWSQKTSQKKEHEKAKEAKRKSLEEKADAAEKKAHDEHEGHAHGDHKHGDKHDDNAGHAHEAHDHKSDAPVEEHAHKKKEDKEDKKEEKKEKSATKTDAKPKKKKAE